VGRLSNFFNKRSIDDRLLTGELSPDSGAGSARAERLVDRRHRARSAKGLRELVEEAHRDHPSMFNANLPVQFLAIRENAALILTLARELEELAEVDPRGVILADRLIQDGNSPAYAREDDGQLVRAVERARAALSPD
jgi:hypothetical protein